MIKKDFILGLIIGIIISGGIVYAATTIASSYVTYTGNSQSTVEGALNDLYTKSRYGDAAASDIKSGKKALVNGSYVTGTLTVPSYTSLSGTTTIQPGNSSTTLSGYYNLSSYKVSCAACTSTAKTGTIASPSTSTSYTINTGLSSVSQFTLYSATQLKYAIMDQNGVGANQYMAGPSCSSSTPDKKTVGSTAHAACFSITAVSGGNVTIKTPSTNLGGTIYWFAA